MLVCPALPALHPRMPSCHARAGGGRARALGALYPGQRRDATAILGARRNAVVGSAQETYQQEAYRRDEAVGFRSAHQKIQRTRVLRGRFRVSPFQQVPRHQRTLQSKRLSSWAGFCRPPEAASMYGYTRYNYDRFRREMQEGHSADRWNRAPEPGDEAPGFELQSLAGEMVRLSDFRGNSNAVITFGSATCPQTAASIG